MITPANAPFRRLADPAIVVRVGQFGAVHACGQPPMMAPGEWEDLRRATLDLLVTDLIEMKHGGIR